MATNLVEGDEFTANVEVPEPGDDRVAASVELPLQALTNRTRYLQNRAGIAGGGVTHQWPDKHTFDAGLVSYAPIVLPPGNEVLYGDETGAPVLRTRTVRLPASSFVPDVIGDAPVSSGVSPAWQYSASGRSVPDVGQFSFGWYAASNDEYLVAEFCLPSGSLFTSASALTEMGTVLSFSPTAYIQAGITRAVSNGVIRYRLEQSRTSAGVVTVNSNAGGSWPNEAYAPDIVSTIDEAKDVCFVRLRRGVGGFLVIPWVTVTFSVPGPR